MPRKVLTITAGIYHHPQLTDGSYGHRAMGCGTTCSRSILYVLYARATPTVGRHKKDDRKEEAEVGSSPKPSCKYDQ
jgi:hypothetical protein